MKREYFLLQVTLTCGLISVGLEMCLEGALYMTIKIVPGPGKPCFFKSHLHFADRKKCHFADRMKCHELS